MLLRHSLLNLALLSSLSTAATASTHEVQMQLDARQLQPGMLAGDDAGRRIELSAGDTLTVDIRFLPGQTLQLDNPMSFSLMTGSLDLSNAISFNLQNQLTLRDARGQVIGSASATQTVNGNALQNLFFGSQVGAPMFGTLGVSSLSFSTTVLSYGDGASQHLFGDSRLALVAGGLSATVSAVPEPSGAVLGLAGLAALALWTARKRRAQQRD